MGCTPSSCMRATMRARVDAAREEHAERHVAHQMALDGARAASRSSSSLPLGLGAPLARGATWPRERPSSARAHRPARAPGSATSTCPGGSWRDAGEDATPGPARSRASGSRAAPGGRCCGSRPPASRHFASEPEQQPVAELGDVERLDADAVAPEHEAARASRPRARRRTCRRASRRRRRPPPRRGAR